MKLAFVFCQMVLKLPCSLLKILSAVQNTLRAVKEVFHNYSDVDGELGNGKTFNAQMLSILPPSLNSMHLENVWTSYMLGMVVV